MSSSQEPGGGRATAVVADDHAFFRDGLVTLLEECGLEVLEDVPNGDAALASVLRHHPDVLILDLSMPGISGFDVARRLTQASTLTRVVMLTVSQDEEDVLNAFLSGVDAYVLKDGPIEDVVTAVEEVCRGQAFLSPRVARLLTKRRSGDARRQRPAGQRLSDHEQLVLDLLASPMNLRQISARLRTTPTKVREIIAEILQKLQVESRGDIAVSSMRDRIV